MINDEERGEKNATKRLYLGNVAMLLEDIKIDRTQKALQRTNSTLQKNKQELQFTM